MLLAAIASKPVRVVSRGATVTEAAEMMRENHVGCLVVVEKESGRDLPIGILTDRDIIVEVVAKGIAAERLCVGDIMTTEVQTVRANQDIHEAIREMELSGVRRLPVIDEEGGVIGIISSDDIYGYLSSVAYSLAKISGIQRAWEQSSRR